MTEQVKDAGPRERDGVCRGNGGVRPELKCAAGVDGDCGRTRRTAQAEDAAIDGGCAGVVVGAGEFLNTGARLGDAEGSGVSDLDGAGK